MGMFSHWDDDFDPKWLDPDWKPTPRTPEEIEADRKFRLEMEAEMLRIDKLYGRIQVGVWSPFGPVRDPETADNPSLAIALNKRL